MRLSATLQTSSTPYYKRWTKRMVPILPATLPPHQPFHLDKQKTKWYVSFYLNRSRELKSSKPQCTMVMDSSQFGCLSEHNPNTSEGCADCNKPCRAAEQVRELKEYSSPTVIINRGSDIIPWAVFPPCYQEWKRFLLPPPPPTPVFSLEHRKPKLYWIMECIRDLGQLVYNTYQLSSNYCALSAFIMGTSHPKVLLFKSNGEV